MQTLVELSEQCPGLDIILTPVGGGLISGSAIAARALIEDVIIYVEGIISGGNVDLEQLPFIPQSINDP